MAFAGGGVARGVGGAGWGAGCRAGGGRLMNRASDSACSHAPLKSVTRTTLARWPRAFPRAPDHAIVTRGAFGGSRVPGRHTSRPPRVPSGLPLSEPTCNSGPRSPRPDSPIHPPPARRTILRATAGPSLQLSAACAPAQRLAKPLEGTTRQRRVGQLPPGLFRGRTLPRRPGLSSSR